MQHSAAGGGSRVCAQRARPHPVTMPGPKPHNERSSLLAAGQPVVGANAVFGGSPLLPPEPKPKPPPTWRKRVDMTAAILGASLVALLSGTPNAFNTIGHKLEGDTHESDAYISFLTGVGVAGLQMSLPGRCLKAGAVVRADPHVLSRVYSQLASLRTPLTLPLRALRQRAPSLLATSACPSAPTLCCWCCATFLLGSVQGARTCRHYKQPSTLATLSGLDWFRCV